MSTDQTCKQSLSKVPIVLEKHNQSFIQSTRIQLLVPKTFTIADISWLARKHADLGYDQSVILFVNKKIPQRTQTLDEVYQLFADPDGILYITYRGESLLESSRSFSKMYDTIATMIVSSVYSNLSRNSKIITTDL